MIDFKQVRCPVCDSSDYQDIGYPRKRDSIFSTIEHPMLDKSKVVRCNACALFYMQPMPCFTASLLEKMYSIDNQYFMELTDRMEKILHHDNPARRFKTLETHARFPIKNYLEIGCGQGFGLQAAQKKGWNVFGQDISPDFATIVKQKTDIDIFVGQLTKDSFPTGMMDVVYIDSVLEHVPNPKEYLELSRRLLAPHGLLYLVLPNENSIPNRLFDIALRILGRKTTSRLMPFAEPYHILGFSKTSIRHLGAAVGLKMKYLTCDFSQNHIQRYRHQNRTYSRKILGLLQYVCDKLNDGVNMEVLFSNS